VKRLLATLALATVALAAAACAPANAGAPGTPAATAAVDPSSPVVVAKDIKFQTTDVKAAAGKAFAMRFENQDSAPHNVSIYTDSSASQRVFEGEIFSQGSRVYQVPALAAGAYFFRCDVHPDMTGTLTVE
jgi:plastocyanin